MPRYRGDIPRVAWVVLSVAAGAALCFLVLHQHWGFEWPAGDLKALSLREAPLPENARLRHSTDIHRLAEQDERFRDWLVGVVCSDEVDIKLRNEALYQLLEMRSDSALVEVCLALLPWLSQPADTLKELELQQTARVYGLRAILFTTDLPGEDILDVMERGAPEWRAGTEAFFKPSAREAAPGASDVARKEAKRFSEVLALAQQRDEARFQELLTENAPSPEGAEPQLADLPRLAEGDPEFRKWLASVVASADEDRWVRALAFKPLLDMESDEAVRDLVGDLHAWLGGSDVEVDREGRDQRNRVRKLMLDRLLLTELPIEEVLELARRSLPYWSLRARALATQGLGERSRWSREQRARLRERAMALAKCAGGQLLGDVQRSLASGEQTQAAKGASP